MIEVASRRKNKLFHGSLQISFYTNYYDYVQRNVCKYRSRISILMILIVRLCNFFIGSESTKRATFGTARWSAAILDKRRTNRGPSSRLEQKDDNQSSVSFIWHSVQFPVDVRAR